MEIENQGFLSHRVRYWLGCYALLIIPIGMLSVFVYIPVLWAFIGSLYAFEVGGDSEFLGLTNFIEFLFRDPTTWPSVGNMFFLTGFMVVTRLTMPLIVAKLIFSLTREPSRYFYRVVFLVPIVVPGVAMQLIWAGMIYNDAGMINEFLRAAHDWVQLRGIDIDLEGLTRGWLADPRTALFAVAFVGFPWVGGIDVLIYYAGLSGIPTSVNEAALIEGCTGLRKFFLIDIPMVMSQLKLIMVISLIMGIQMFEGLFIMTRGGPGFRTMVPALWMYFNAFSFQRMGYGCAIGVFLFALIFGCTVLTFRYVRSTEELEGRA